MIYASLPQYLADAFAPLKYVMLAYVMSGEERDSSKADYLTRLFGLSDLPSAAAAWTLYAEEEEKTAKRVRATVESGAVLPIEHACGVFGLNSFERFAMTLTLASETDPIYGAAISALSGNLSLGLLLRLYSASPEECIGWQAQWLRDSRALRLIFADAQPVSPLSLRPTVKKFLMGADMLPEGVSLLAPEPSLPEPLIMCDAWDIIARQLELRPEGNLFILTGTAGAGRKYALKRFSAKNGKTMLLAPFDRLRGDGAWLNDLAAALALTNGFLCVSDLPAGSLPDNLLKLMTEIRPSNLFATCEEAARNVPDCYSAVPVPIPVLGRKERLAVWRAYAGDLDLSGGLDGFACQYVFAVGQIEKAAALARLLGAQRGGAVTASLLHEACRSRLSHEFGSLAIPVSARFTWDDLVLPPAQIRLLHHICNQVKYRDIVYGDWEFESKIACRLGVRALFSGPPGTGKTMAAQVVASELNMELYRVDISSLVSKYIGDTEKNLNEVFSQAAKSGGILFFDEADALFGKRGEQKDSHDKYANMQTAFLLQRFEEYDGVVLLATNLISNLDPAFTRRFQNRVDFPVPTADYRKRIWDALLIRTAPFADDIDTAFLAESFELTGSAIRSIVLQAAFMGAAAGCGIGMGELVGALVMELAKAGKIISKKDLGEYGYYWPDNV